MSQDFPCTGCGACCRSVFLSKYTSWLDRGDGTCRDFDDSTSRCSVYENRPTICNVRVMYEADYKNKISWEDFVSINLQACNSLSGRLRESG